MIITINTQLLCQPGPWLLRREEGRCSECHWLPGAMYREVRGIPTTTSMKQMSNTSPGEQTSKVLNLQETSRTKKKEKRKEENHLHTQYLAHTGKVKQLRVISTMFTYHTLDAKGRKQEHKRGPISKILSIDSSKTLQTQIKIKWEIKSIGEHS